LEEEESMIVTCESCRTKFRLDPARIRGPESKVRCTRCGFIFVVRQEDEDDVLIHVDLSEEALRDDENKSVSRSMPKPSIPQRPRRKGSLRKLLILAVALLLLVGGVFWLVSNKDSFLPTSQSAAPEKATVAETKQPVITIMDATQAYFLENARAGRIFVVEGEVSNESAGPVSFMLLEGKLYTRDNHVAQSQRCFSGNSMSREDLTRLSVREIQDRMMNREGKDLNNVHVATGKRVPFMLVFHNLPELDVLSDYSIEVISAKMD
jgi:predicted Zn finger-like uncharacterized protein